MVSSCNTPIRMTLGRIILLDQFGHLNVIFPCFENSRSHPHFRPHFLPNIYLHCQAIIFSVQLCLTSFSSMQFHKLKLLTKFFILYYSDRHFSSAIRLIFFFEDTGKIRSRISEFFSYKCKVGCDFPLIVVSMLIHA